jgi:hypothetical protein
MLRVYREKLVGAVPKFPAHMEQNINNYLAGNSVARGESLSAVRNDAIQGSTLINAAALGGAVD